VTEILEKNSLTEESCIKWLKEKGLYNETYSKETIKLMCKVREESIITKE